MSEMSRRDFMQKTGGAVLAASLSGVAAHAAEGSLQPVPFRVAIGDDQLDDLKARLQATRWPDAVTDDWSRGQPTAFIRELTTQWAESFDWRSHEAALNEWPQFTVEIDGQTIHFLHVKSPEAKAMGLILTHGWPSSVAEFSKVIGPLTDPRAHGLDPALAFDVVIPSLPGFGFSTPLAGPGWDAIRTAKAWDTLMTGLGYERYGAQGGDLGALVTREMGILAPPGLVGVHLQQIFAFPTGAAGEMDTLSPFEAEGMAHFGDFERLGVYERMHSIRPSTLAFGLVDSPVGLLGWNAELVFGFGGEGAQFADREQYLLHTALYWFSGTAGSAANFYYENEQSNAGYREDMRNDTPTGVAVFPYDFRSVRSFAERSNAIVHWSEMAYGGHFAAFEAPDLLVADIRAFFGGL